jgi:hypothetical protein
MTRNKKLENILSGEGIVSIRDDDDGFVVTLANGAHMKVKGNITAAIPTGLAISQVWQQGCTLRLGFADGTATDIALQAETSSILVRSAQGEFLYAD